jgi:cytochrome c biogenesis protein CcmG/thiol:disulfide interchange protein DsbE
MKPIHALPLLMLALIGAVFAFGLRNDPRALPAVLIDEPLPQFSLASLLEGEPNLTNDMLAGAPALINIFGSWCAACIIEHPVLMKIAAEGAVALYGVDWNDTREAGHAFLAARGNPYRAIGMDPDSRFAIAMGVSGAPETFVIDAQGRIRYKHVGPITDEVWSNTLHPLLLELERGP